MSPGRLGLSVAVCVLSLCSWSRADAPFLFSIRGAYQAAENGSSEALFSVNLAVPFDAWLAPHVPQRRVPARLVTASLAEVPMEGSESASSGADLRESPEAESAAGRGSAVHGQVAELLLDSRMVRATVRRALRVAESARTTARLQSLSARARSSALLPELRLRGGRSRDESLRLSPTIDDPLRYTQTGGADLFFEASLTWRLNRLVFANEELSVERLLRQARQEDLRVIQRVLAALYRFQRAVFTEADDLLTPLELGKARLERVESELELDVWTDGWFTAELSRWDKARQARPTPGAGAPRESTQSERPVHETPDPPQQPAPPDERLPGPDSAETP